jgi:isopentenyl-diphosphate delta-isomerase
MGIAVSLTWRGTFIYRAELGAGLVEHELDHLFVGHFAGTPTADPNEAAEWRWQGRSQLEADCAAQPSRYTAWLPLALAALAERE